MRKLEPCPPGTVRLATALIYQIEIKHALLKQLFACLDWYLKNSLAYWNLIAIFEGLFLFYFVLLLLLLLFFFSKFYLKIFFFSKNVDKVLIMLNWNTVLQNKKSQNKQQTTKPNKKKRKRKEEKEKENQD